MHQNNGKKITRQISNNLPKTLNPKNWLKFSSFLQTMNLRLTISRRYRCHPQKTFKKQILLACLNILEALKTYGLGMLMFGTLPTYTGKITLYKPQGCFQVYGLKHSLYLMESHNVILFNYVTNYAIFSFSNFFLNFVM